MADFGWSASCIVEAIKTTNKIRKALQESGGAKEHYTETVAFLGQIDATFKHLEKHVKEHPDSPYRDAIGQQLKLIESPWERVEASYVDKYEKSLGEDSMRSKLRQAPRMMQWAMKDIDGVVRKEKARILEPLGMIGSLLSLGLMEEVKRLNQKCQKIVEELEVANLSSMVENCLSGIDDHAITEETVHAKQLERITEMHRMIERRHSEMVDIMRSFSAHITLHARQRYESTNSLSDGTAEITSIVMRVEKKLQDPIASWETIQSKLEEQKSSLNRMQITLEELVARHKTTSLNEMGVNSEGTPLTSLTMLATAASAFALGYSAALAGAQSVVASTSGSSTQADEQSSISTPSDQQVQQPQQRYRTRAVTRTTIDEFVTADLIRPATSSQKDSAKGCPEGSHPVRKESRASSAAYVSSASNYHYECTTFKEEDEAISYCCKCGAGPHIVALFANCVSCRHMLCLCCQVENTMSIFSHRDRLAGE